MRDTAGRTGSIKVGKIDLKPRIQSKLDAIIRPIAQQIITYINDGTYIKDMGLRCVVGSRVATAGMLMPRGTRIHYEQINWHGNAALIILKEQAILIAARKTQILKEQAILIAARKNRYKVVIVSCIAELLQMLGPTILEFFLC